MQSSARAIISAVGRGAELLTDVDYHLADAVEEKEAIYNLRYRAYLREGAVKESPDARVTDQYDDLPNAWTFGVYLRGELCSSVRISVLTSEWRSSTSADVFPDVVLPRLDRGEVMINRGFREFANFLAHGLQAFLDPVHGLRNVGLFSAQSRHVHGQVAGCIVLDDIECLTGDCNVRAGEFVGRPRHFAVDPGEIRRLNDVIGVAGGGLGLPGAVGAKREVAQAAEAVFRR